MQTSAEMLYKMVLHRKKHPKQTAQILSTYSKILFIVIVRFGFRLVYSMTARNCCLTLLYIAKYTLLLVHTNCTYITNQNLSFCLTICNSVLLTYCKEDPIYVFPEMKLRGPLPIFFTPMYL
jgi:hypothetical protein